MESITGVAMFTDTSRLSECPSGRMVVEILSCMRVGRNMSDATWEALKARRLRTDLRDPRLDEERFQNGHEGGFIWEVVGRLQQLRAIQDAKVAGARLFYVQAVDCPGQAAHEFSRADAMAVLKDLNMTRSGYMLGMCPLFIGMRVRITQQVEVPLLVREVKGVIRNFQPHPREHCYWQHDGSSEPVLLRYLPAAIIVELDDKELRQHTFLKGFPPGYVAIPPQQQTWTWKQYVEVEEGGRESCRTRAVTMDVTRRQIPLAPQRINTQFGLQGITAQEGMIAYCYKHAQLKPADYFLSVYVLLSRATKLKDLLLAGLPDRTWFATAIRDPGLAELRKRIMEFEERAKQDAVKADALIASFGWPTADALAASWCSTAATRGEGVEPRPDATAQGGGEPPATGTSMWFLSNAYFERESEAGSVRACLNNVFGKYVVSDCDIANATEKIRRGRRTVGAEVESEDEEDVASIEAVVAAVAATGDYVLEEKPMGINFDMLQYIFDCRCAGLFVYRGPGGRCVAIRNVGAKLWLLDNTSEPVALTDQSYKQYIMLYPQTFAITRVLRPQPPSPGVQRGTPAWFLREHFFERQEAMRCGKHALNNALGRAAFSDADLSRACDVFIEESLVPSNEGGPVSAEVREDHERRDGWYSIEVMAQALRRSLLYELLLAPLGEKENEHLRNYIVDPRCGGIVVNQANRHWVAIRYVDAQI